MTGPCYRCGRSTDRFVRFAIFPNPPAALAGTQPKVAVTIQSDYECLACRAARVADQVARGLRPESDLLAENLPENRSV